MISNLTWVLLDYNSIVKKWINRYTKVTHAYAFHVDSSTLADGTDKLVPESKSEQREAQVNLTEAAEDPNQSSEEPMASFAQESKPRSMTYYFQLYATYYFYLLVHLSYRSLLKSQLHEPRFSCYGY